MSSDPDPLPQDRLLALFVARHSEEFDCVAVAYPAAGGTQLETSVWSRTSRRALQLAAALIDISNNDLIARSCTCANCTALAAAAKAALEALLPVISIVATHH